MPPVATELEDDETRARWTDAEDEDEDDETESDDDDESESPSEDDAEAASSRAEADPARRSPERARRPRTHASKKNARGPNGMGRLPSGPPVRARAEMDVETEIVDTSDWPGTALAAKMVGRHTSTIKAWRSQGRLRAVQGPDGTWRYHPEDLAELETASDASDPASVLAAGMTSIVTQGASASERLLAMTELTTAGMERSITLLSNELERAYTRITALETERVALIDRLATGRVEEMRHERQMRRIDQAHALELESAKETTARLAGLVQILGPVAATLVQQIVQSPRDPSAPAPVNPAAAPTDAVNPVAQAPQTFESRVADAMGRLSIALRALPPDAVTRLGALAGPSSAAHLETVTRSEDAKEIGRALGALTVTLRQLDPTVFRALSSLCPPELAAVATELRTLLTAPPGERPPE